MEFDFLTILFVVINIPALIAMSILLYRVKKLPAYKRVIWVTLSLLFPISGLVLYTVQYPGIDAYHQEA